MEKIVVIHQPDLLPYLGFFHRLLIADVYVVFDHVQFLRGSKSWHNRDKIKTPKGAKWITVSVQKGKRETPINEVILSQNTEWRKNNLNQITENYKQAPFLNEILPYIKELYAFECEKMVDFNLKSIKMLIDLFDINVEIIFSSALNPKGKSNELIVEILKKIESHKYLSGVGAKAYYDPRPFEEEKIEVLWQDFKHPVYPQLHGEFMPYLSSIDLLFNCGIEKSRKILRECLRR